MQLTIKCTIKKEQNKYQPKNQFEALVINQFTNINNHLDNIENRLENVETDINQIKNTPTMKKELN